MFDSTEEKIRESALRILDFGDCSRSEIKRKLKKKGFSSDGIDRVLQSLTESGLLDDSRYAQNYVRSAMEKGKGPGWIRNKLAEKGVSASLINLAFEELDTGEQELELCLKKALSLLDLKDKYETDGDGHLIFNGSGDPDEVPDPFSRRIPENADRREIRAMRDKEKARLARRLAGAGFSQSAVYAVIHVFDSLKY